MYRDVEEILTRELREVADGVTVPSLPDLPSAPPARLVWQPMLVAAALVLVALATVASLLRMDGGQSPQPAPQPTDVVTDDATDAALETVPTGPPAVPYLLDGRIRVGETAVDGEFWSVAGTETGWLALQAPSVWWWANSAEPQVLEAPTVQPPVVSPLGDYVAYIDVEGLMNGFQTAPAGEGMGLPVEVPVNDEDGVGTRIGAVTDDGWVIASGRGVGVLWRPFVVDAEVVDLTETAPGQQVWQATRAGIVAYDASGDARTPGDGGRVYLADITGEGEIAPIAELPNFALLDAAGGWVAWVPPGVIEGEVTSYDAIEVRRLDETGDGVLSPPRGWQFVNRPFTFEDNQFLVAAVTDGEQERMVRCSPELQECVLLDTP